MILQSKLIVLMASLIHINSPDSLHFQLFGKDPCDGTSSPTVFFSLTKKGEDKKYKPDSGGVCTLPSTGIYQLRFANVDYSITYHFNGQASDTLNFPAVNYPGFGHHIARPELYTRCSKYHDGYYVEYFKSGHKRMEGTFKNRRLVGKLTYYDLDGKIVRVEYSEPEKKKRKKHTR